MDITLIRTFLEVSATGSFGGAAERLAVTQSAVSLRIQREGEGGTALTENVAWKELIVGKLSPDGSLFPKFLAKPIQSDRGAS